MAGYLGNAPTAVPLTSADITDGIITSAKIADGTIVNGDINASAGIVASKLSGVQGKFESALLHVRDEKSAGTQGGSATSGSFLTRTLNTSVTNEISGASLSSNQITLPSGTYYVIAKANAYQINFNKLRLRNITDSSNTLIGFTSMMHNGTDSQGQNFLDGRFTISAQKTFELQMICDVTNTTNGFGRSVNSTGGLIEIYVDVQIWKVV